MGYKYEVFISYRQRQEWSTWVEKQFLPIFKTWLFLEVGDCEVFFDKNMRTGISWPLELAKALSCSKVLVPLWSKQYIESKWCKAELNHMLQREKKHDLNQISNTGRLIIPVIIHDGENIKDHISDKDHIGDISYLQIKECTNPFMAENSPMKEELSNKIRDWVPDVAKSIALAPEFNSEWESSAAEKFRCLYSQPDLAPEFNPEWESSAAETFRWLHSQPDSTQSKQTEVPSLE